MTTYILTETKLRKALLDAFIHGTEVEAGATNKSFEFWVKEKIELLTVNKESVIDWEGLVTGDKSLIEHSCDAPLKTCAAIEQIRGKNLRKLHAVSEDKDLWLESEVNDILIRNDDTLYEIKETSKVYTSFKQINKS